MHWRYWVGSNILGSKMWHLGPIFGSLRHQLPPAEHPFHSDQWEKAQSWSWRFLGLKSINLGHGMNQNPHDVPWFCTVFRGEKHPASSSDFDGWGYVWWVSIHSYMAQGRSGPIRRVISWTWNLWTWLTAIGGPVVPFYLNPTARKTEHRACARPQLPEKLPTNKSGFLGVHWGCRPAFHCTLPGHMSWFLGRVRYTWVSR